MSSEKSARNPRGGASIWLVRLIFLALVAGILLIFGKVWFQSVMGCVSMIGGATYEDNDELSRAPVQTPIPPMDLFSDSAYDRTFPDLVEPTLNPAENAQ